MSKLKSKLAAAGFSISLALLAACSGGDLTGPGDNTASVVRASGDGVIHIATVTSGGLTDPDGYTLSIDGKQNGVIGVVDSRSIEGLAGPMHEVELSGVATHCEVRDGARRSVSLRGGMGWVEYVVVCSGADQLRG